MIFKKLLSVFIILVLFCFVVYVVVRNNVNRLTNNPSQPANSQNVTGTNSTNLSLSIPDNYSFSIFATDLNNPRDLIFDNQNNILVTDTSGGRVISINISNPTDQTIILSGLNKPHGLALNCSQNCKLFVAQTNQVDVYDYQNSTALNKAKIIDLPNAGFHFTRSLLIKDSKLYIAIGSSCNVCSEADSRRAAIYSANLDGSDFKPFATGLRNSVFMTTNPQTGDIWATDMGRDYLGDDLPPDEINIIHSGDYGWPYCYADNTHDNNFDPNNRVTCIDRIPAHIQIPAHSAPLGLSFISPRELLVSYHGSWNRSVPTGYKIVKMTLDNNGDLVSIDDFITGWIKDGQVMARPVDILTLDDGKTSYITDDKSGVIYKLQKLN